MTPPPVVLMAGENGMSLACHGNASPGVTGIGSVPWWSWRRPPSGSAAAFSGSKLPSLFNCKFPPPPFSVISLSAPHQ